MAVCFKEKSDVSSTPLRKGLGLAQPHEQGLRHAQGLAWGPAQPGFCKLVTRPTNLFLLLFLYIHGLDQPSRIGYAGLGVQPLLFHHWFSPGFIFSLAKITSNNSCITPSTHFTIPCIYPSNIIIIITHTHYIVSL